MGPELSETLAAVGLDPHQVRVARTWTSRTATLTHVLPVAPPAGSGPELPAGGAVIKLCDAWRSDQAGLVEDNARWMRAASTEVAGASVVPVIASSASPPVVVTPFVAGIDLPELLAGARGGVPTAPVRAVGELLAALHRAGRRRRTAWPARRSVSSAGDFGAYNFRCDDEGHAVYVEPPPWNRTVSIHRDLAVLMGSLDLVALPRSSRRSLRAAFLEGYRRGAPWSWRLADWALLRLALARWRRARRVRRRRASP